MSRIEKKQSSSNTLPLVILVILIMLPLSVPVFAADRIVLCRAGETDDVMWNNIKKYLAGKGFVLGTYEAARTIEKQIETANKINKEKARLTLVIEIVTSNRSDAYVAITDAKKAKGLILNADEVPAVHAARSEELGSSIAARFQKKVKRAPLFMLLGIDMPAAFVRLNVSKDNPMEAFDKLYDGILNFTKRGNKDERELKGERRDSSTED